MLPIDTRVCSRTCIIGGAVAVLLGWSPAAGAAQLSSPSAVTPDGVEITGFALATNIAGTRSALLYHGRSRPQRPRDPRLAVRLGRGSALGPSRTLDASVSYADPKVAVGPDGTVAAAWLSSDRGRVRLRVALAAPGRGFGRPQTLVQSRSRFSLGGVVVGARGRAVVGWQSLVQGGNAVRVAFRRPGGRFGAAQTLGGTNDGAPRLAIAPSGAVLAAWGAPVARARPILPDQAAAAVMAPGASRFGPPAVLSDDAGGAGSIAVSSGPGGAAVSFVARLGVEFDAPAVLRFARLRTRSLEAVATLPGQAVQEYALGLPVAGVVAAWRSSQSLSGTSTLALEVVGLDRMTGPPVAGALTDRTLVAWSQKTGPGAARVRLGVRTSDRWEPARTVSRGRAIRNVAIASGRRSALLAWVQRDRAFPGRLRLAEYRR